MALSRPLQPRDRRKRPARKGRAKAACAKTNTDWQLRKVRKILDTTDGNPIPNPSPCSRHRLPQLTGGVCGAGSSGSIVKEPGNVSGLMTGCRTRPWRQTQPPGAMRAI